MEEATQQAIQDPVNPIGAAGGTTNAAAGTTATSAASPAGATTYTMSTAEYQQYLADRARFAEAEVASQRAAQEAQRREAEALAQAGQIREALTMVRAQTDQQIAAERQARQQTEERARRYALDGELSRALASQQLVPGGAEQLTQLWRSQLTVDSQGDSFVVRTPTFQPVGEFVAQQLARPEYSHFVRAQNPGGGTGGVDPAGQAAPTNPAQTPLAPQPRNMGEAVILHMQGIQKAQGDPRANMNLSMGLKRTAE